MNLQFLQCLVHWFVCQVLKYQVGHSMTLHPKNDVVSDAEPVLFESQTFWDSLSNESSSLLLIKENKTHQTKKLKGICVTNSPKCFSRAEHLKVL